MSGSTPDMRPSDEVLLAYAEGMLPAEEAAAVARHLETDDEARHLVESFRRTAGLAAGAYAHILDLPVPDRLVQAARGTAAAPSQGAPTNVIPLRERRRSSARMPSYLAAMAASVLVIVGAVGGYYAAQPPGQPAGPLVLAVGPVEPGGIVARLLETAASHQPVTHRQGAGSGDLELVVVASFKDGHGRICRELEVAPAQSEAVDSPGMTGAVACRGEAGQWSILAAVRHAGPLAGQVAGQVGPATGNITPASGATSSPIEAVLSAIGANEAIPAAEEKALIERRWTAGPQ